MSSMFEVIREIVESEVRKINIAEVGEVTSIFPHSSDSDKDNYECNVKLKYKELELRKVPVATQHIGLANTPNVGDLVLITFVNGNINAPVIIGRLYTDEDRPPVHKEEEIVYIPSYSKESGLRRIHVELSSGMVLTLTDEDFTVKAGKTTLKLNLDGDIDVESSGKINVKAAGDISVETDENISLSAGKDLSVTAGQNISLSAGQDFSLSATNVKADSSANMEYTAGAQAQIEASGPLTIKGATAEMEASGPLTIKGATAEMNASGPLTMKGAVILIG